VFKVYASHPLQKTMHEVLARHLDVADHVQPGILLRLDPQ
jgi:hypothetical protein